MAYASGKWWNDRLQRFEGGDPIPPLLTVDEQDNVREVKPVDFNALLRNARQTALLDAISVIERVDTFAAIGLLRDMAKD